MTADTTTTPLRDPSRVDAAPAPRLTPRPLSAAAFAPYGRVLQAGDEALAAGEAINGGTSLRLELVPDARLGAGADRPVIALMRAQARALPMALTALERHRLGSQSFVPLAAPRRFVVVVARPGPAPAASDLAAFVTDGTQGVWLAPGTWHHALLALDAGDFLVIERRGALPDCEEAALATAVMLQL